MKIKRAFFILLAIFSMYLLFGMVLRFFSGGYWYYKFMLKEPELPCEYCYFQCSKGMPWNYNKCVSDNWCDKIN